MKEEDIRKRAAFDRYLELSARDAKLFFDPALFVIVPCPACGGRDHEREFVKLGFIFVSCRGCGTLFVNPRPTSDMLKRFYADSESTRYFVDTFFSPVAEARREKIFKPRAGYAGSLLEKKSGMVVGDIGAGFGIFLEELRKERPDNRYVAIEPSRDMADICARKGLTVRCLPFEDVDEAQGSFDLLTAFELLEHLADPAVFLKKAHALLKPGGFFFATTLNAKGFDIALLWDRSKSVSPPHHLTLFNPVSMETLLRAIGFEMVVTETPGTLDWDIAEGMILRENVDLGRFWNVFAREGSVAAKRDLQQWITRHNLSSHMRIVAKKRTG